MSKKNPRKDLNENAFSIVPQAIGEVLESPSDGKNPAAVALGRLGGKLGGKARAAKLTPGERSEIARKAAKARWQPSEASESDKSTKN